MHLLIGLAGAASWRLLCRIGELCLRWACWHCLLLIAAPLGPGSYNSAALCGCVVASLMCGTTAAVYKCAQRVAFLWWYQSRRSLPGWQALRAGLVGPSGFPDLALEVLPASLTKLVLLSPVEAGLLSLAPTGLQHLQLVCDVEGPGEGPGSLLSCVARVTCLTGLILQPPNSLEFEWPSCGAAYAALTASSNLVHLDMVDPSFPGTESVWLHIFHAVRKLPHLTSLTLHAASDDVAYNARPSWGAADLSRLVSCCAGLCVAEPLFMEPQAYVSELRKLAAETSLHVHCVLDPQSPCSLDVFTRGLAALPQLKSLILHAMCAKLSSSEELSRSSLLPLTSLTSLTYLDFELLGGPFELGHFHNYGYDDADEDLGLRLSTPQVSRQHEHVLVVCFVSCRLPVIDTGSE